MKTKRLFLQALAASLLAAPLVSPAQVAVHVSYIPILDVTPLFVGIEKGFFKQQGLDVTAQPSSGGATGVPGLIGGAYEVIYGNVVSTYLAQSQGFKLKIIAAGTKLTPEAPMSTGIVARKGEGLQGGKDLEGKTVGVNTRNGVIWLFARSWIAKTGGDPGKVRFREVPFPQMTDALRTRQVDAAFNVDPFFSAAAANPEFAVIGQPYPEVQPGVEVGQWIMTEEFYRKNPEVVRKYTTAFRQAVAWHNAHLDTPELRKIVAGFTRMKPELVEKIQLPPLPERIDPAAQQATADLMLESGMLKSRLDVKAVISAEAVQ
jgi:NitT/TauT family transport system substrate-binding protein